MAPSFKPGKKSRLWANSIRLSRITDNFELKRACDTTETTTHEDDDKTFVPTLRSGDFSFAGIHDGSTTPTQKKLEVLGSTVISCWTKCPEGSAIGALALMWKAWQTQLNISSPANGRVNVSGGCQPTSAVKKGVALLPGITAITTTAAQTAVDSGLAAGTAGGGRGHFHLTDQSTVTNFVAKIQHSSAAAVWADLLTFTSTSTGFQGSTIAGTIKRHLRANVTTFTGGAPKSVNCMIAFARST